MKHYSLLCMTMLINLVLVVALVSCEDFVVFDFSQATSDSEKAGSLEELFSNGKVKGKAKLETPKIRVSQGEYADKIVIAWKAVKDAQYYRVLRRKKPQGAAPMPFSLIKAVVPQGRTSYDDVFDINVLTDEDLYASYQYRVEARTYKGAKNTSLHSEDGYLLLPPEVLQPSKSLPSIILTWKDIRGAARYKVYRSESEGSLGTLLPLTFGKALRRFVDVDESLSFGKNYYYYVVSVGASGNTSDLRVAQQVMGMRIDADAPKPPRSVVAEKAEALSEIKVTWDPVPPSDDSHSIVYNVFKNSSLSSRMIELASGIEYTEYIDTDALVENIAYHYFVQAIEKTSDGGVLIGGYSANVDLTLGENPQTGYVFSSPKVVEARRVGNNMKITWTKAKKATGYKVYKADSIDGIYKELATVDDVGEYVHGEAAQATVFYKVLSVRDDVSPPMVTKEENAQAIEPLPSVPEKVQASRNAYYDEHPYKTWSGTVYPVKVSWEKAAGAVRYTLWRSESQDGIYVKVVRVSSTEAYDESPDMEVGKYYYYKVSAENGTGASTERSAVSRGYGALSNNELVNQLNRTIGSSHRKLTLMHNNGLNALGNETKNGSVSGNVSYNGSLAGLGAKIISTYTNYADKSDSLDATKASLIINGSNTTTVNMLSNGTQSLDYSIGGMYGHPRPAKITGNLTITSAVASGGTYTVKQNNGVPHRTVNNDNVVQP